IIAAFAIFWIILMNRSGGGGMDRTMKFSKARTRLGSDEKKKVTFKDVAGADEEKAELEEIVQYLKNPARFVQIGARIPKGVLLVGPPGTGKTLIAKAVAGEAGVQFLSISGSDFVELYVGVGASRVRDLFDQAKKNAPSIVFIDEIDAVGRRRGAGMGGGHDEREQTLNQLLVEMDGFGSNEGVIVMAATNRQDILDPALMRPGRFDRQIYVGLPDVKGRQAILGVHAKDKPLAEDVSLETLAKATPGFTGADLENLLNEGALLAARKGKMIITMDDLEQAMLKVIAGPEKRSRVVPPHERKLAAYHEAGHAVAMRCLPTQDPVHQITIIPRGAAGGMTISLPREDRNYRSRKEMLDSIVGLLGGRVAEELVLQDISTGASNDLERATAIAHSMVAKYGMSEAVGPVVFDSGGEVFLGRDYGHTKSYSEEVAAKIDSEVRRILEECYERCRQLLSEHMDKLELLAGMLLEVDTVDAESFEYIFVNGALPPKKEEEPVAVQEDEAGEAFEISEESESACSESENDQL
ncbi:MAG: ATP-dependent zinc metalloprotease FtsH, partial [Oscillospiraceae bacterium]|nr:ATP-dependent zinc metalloprotease FtsH [Oscillospiraceae bacterium]